MAQSALSTTPFSGCDTLPENMDRAVLQEGGYKNISVLIKMEAWLTDKLGKDRIRKRNGKEPGNSPVGLYSSTGTKMNQL